MSSALHDPRLDPQIRAILAFAEAKDEPPLESLSPVEARLAAIDGLAPWKGEAESLALVENRVIAGPEGDIPLRIYIPEVPGPRPALVYFHGGGWVVCDLNTHDVVCRAIAKRSGAVVVSVDYRLAPENKFPAAVVDCYEATRWVHENAAALGVDPHRVAVGGDSAGGNLAAVIAQRSRDEKGPPIALQVMVYPVTDLSSFSTPSYREFAEDYYLTLSEMEWFRNHYLAHPEDATNPYASPLLAPDLRGLPPALVITAECDVLRDEGESYARRLDEAGVAVRLSRYDGMIHPFFSLVGAVKQSLESIDEIAWWIARCR